MDAPLNISSAQRRTPANDRHDHLVHARDWVARFTAKNGRAPRVLHIGNVGNYAYANAKMMREIGIEADVIDPDFYHIMASPEWHETMVAEDHGDDYFPKWSRSGLWLYDRPDWFMQAPWDFTFRWLNARARKANREEKRMRFAAGVARRMVTGDMPEPLGWLLTGEDAAARFIRRGFRWMARRATSSGAEQPQERHSAQLGAVPTEVAPARPAAPSMESQTGAAQPIDPDQITPASLQYVLDHRELIEPALASYDAIHGYALGAMYPAALGLNNWVAMELGTIRGLPFEDSDLGRITRWLYRRSPQVFITNFDSVDAADRLGIPAPCQHKVTHPYDARIPARYAADFKARGFARAETPYFLAPARHHWTKGNKSILKGNDTYLRGAALAAKTADFQLVLIDWGVDAGPSRELIAELGLTDRVRWLKPHSRKALWPVYMRSVGIIDQFAVAAFGGVALDAMSLGRRLITRMDAEEAERLPTETAPPVMAAATPEAVAKQLLACLADPEDTGEIGNALQDWCLNLQDPDRQLLDQLAVYDRLIQASDSN
jgi:glycosyltransferase involved in cell wall biosynthesis